MSAPLLVLDAGSSSIKFALCDGDGAPLPRPPVGSGRVEGIGRNATLVDDTANATT
ncbi:MAG: hypothetical protein BroJett026_27620 [Betaproteobacteria bacterium]|nr:MAG: hypothetical protein BroJett026_27620 [Betaproteobacteria bacterium]